MAVDILGYEEDTVVVDEFVCLGICVTKYRDELKDIKRIGVARNAYHSLTTPHNEVKSGTYPDQDKSTGLFISPSGISELDCATTKTDTAERSISIENLSKFFLY